MTSKLEADKLQQKLMRHADIRTTMNIYREAATEDMKQVHSKVVRMVLPNLA